MNNISLHDVFASEGIRPKSMAVGTQKIKCPQCQGQNGGHKYSDNPLSLTINDDNNAVWHCHTAIDKPLPRQIKRHTAETNDKKALHRTSSQT